MFTKFFELKGLVGKSNGFNEVCYIDSVKKLGFTVGREEEELENEYVDCYKLEGKVEKWIWTENYTQKDYLKFIKKYY
jgi:hypothetical protein